MAKKLPRVSTEKIDELGRKAFVQSLLTPPVSYIFTALFVILVGGLVGAVYLRSIDGVVGHDPTRIAGITPLLEPTKTPTENIPPEITLEPTPTPSQQSTQTPPPVEPTSYPSFTPSSPTVEAIQPISIPTNTPAVATPTLSLTTEPLPPDVIDPTTLSGKIAAPIFNSQTNTYDLYIVSGPTWQLPAQPFQAAASQPAFSPDGSQIVFRSWGGGQPLTPYGERLVIRNLVGTGERIITTQLEDAHPHWANFDFPILFHSRPAGLSARIYLQALWDGAPQDSNSRRELAVGENPTWLPDGRIVYFSGEPFGNGLYVMNSDGNSKQLIWPTANPVAPEGDPRSNRVVFSYNDDLYLLTVTEGQSQPQPLLVTSDHRERLPVWSPDGQFIAYVKDQMDNRWAVYVIRTDGAGETKLFDLSGSIDGKPINVPTDKTFGWPEEQLAWGQ